jgi:ribosome recycling factor
VLKDKAISEDEEEKSLAEIRKFTDDYIRNLDGVAKRKSGRS